MKLTKGKIIALAIVLILAATAGVYYGIIQPRRKAAAAAAAQKLAKDGGDKDRTFKVRKDNLVIGLLQGGYVNASKKHKLALQANYRTQLLWVIDENSKVKAGTLLAKFETDNLVELIDNTNIELDNLNKELELAYESEKILYSTNSAELQQAEENLLQAADAMLKYRRFERVNTRDSLDQEIQTAEDAASDAEKNYTDTRDKEISSSGNEDAETVRRNELKTAQSKIDTAENNLAAAEDKRRVFRRYDHPSKMTRLANALEQAKLNLRKVKISTESKVVQQKRSIANFRRRIRRQNELLNRYKSYLSMMELRAPVDGVVIYGDPDRRWGNLDVKPGIDVGKGQVLITIPEMSNLIVDFDLPEQYRSKISIGNKATIFPDSLPGTKFTGTVYHIDTLPVNLVSWDSSSPKVYKTKIRFDKQSSQLVNGMSVQINIVTKTIKDILFVPVEAVFEDGGKLFVYRWTIGGPEEVPVVIGESNDNFVQIKKGLEEDDVVYLYRPYQKTGSKAND